MSGLSVQELLDRLGGLDSQELIAEILERWRESPDASSANAILQMVSETLDQPDLTKSKRIAVIFLFGELMHDIP